MTFKEQHDSFLKIADNEQFQEFICSDCGEWTDTLDPCCGVGPVNGEDNPNDER